MFLFDVFPLSGHLSWSGDGHPTARWQLPLLRGKHYYYQQRHGPHARAVREVGMSAQSVQCRPAGRNCDGTSCIRPAIPARYACWPGRITVSSCARHPVQQEAGMDIGDLDCPRFRILPPVSSRAGLLEPDICPSVRVPASPSYGTA